MAKRLSMRVFFIGSIVFQEVLDELFRIRSFSFQEINRDRKFGRVELNLVKNFLNNFENHRELKKYFKGFVRSFINQPKSSKSSNRLITKLPVFDSYVNHIMSFPPCICK